MDTNYSKLFGPGGSGPKMVKQTMFILGVCAIAKWFINNKPRGEGGQSSSPLKPPRCRLISH